MVKSFWGRSFRFRPRSNNEVVSYKSYAHERKIIWSECEDTTFFFCLLWMLLGHSAFLMISGKIDRTEGFGSGLDDSRVHQICGGIGEVDEVLP